MPKRNDAIQNYTNLIDEAKDTAMVLVGVDIPSTYDVFYETDLDKIEQQIKALNEFSSKCWLVSAIALYSLIYDTSLYAKSGLSWLDYLHQSKDRLGMDAREVSEQLSSARFFIKYHKKLIKAGWKPTCKVALARGELGVELSGDIDLTIKHLANDCFRDFKEWYESYKKKPMIESPTKHELKKVTFSKGSLNIDGKPAMTVADDLDEADKKKLEVYIRKIADSLKAGYEPAIIPVYDNREEQALIRLRDKNRQTK